MAGYFSLRGQRPSDENENRIEMSTQRFEDGSLTSADSDPYGKSSHKQNDENQHASYVEQGSANSLLKDGGTSAVALKYALGTSGGKMWNPFWLTTTALASFLLLFVAIFAAVLALYVYSEAHSGLL
jgi:hypothetical protein